MNTLGAAAEDAGRRHGAAGMRLAAIRDLLECEVLTDAGGLDDEVDTAVATDAMSAVLSSPHPKALLITGLSNIQSVRTALIAYISAIVFVRGARPNEATVQLARDRRLVLLATNLNMFDTCGVLANHGIKGAV
jgi:predicted transcriptional regulator